MSGQPKFLQSVRFRFPFYVLFPVVVVILLTALALFSILGQRTLETRSRGYQRQTRNLANNVKLVLSGVERVAAVAALEIKPDLSSAELYSDLEAILHANPDLQGIAVERPPLSLYVGRNQEGGMIRLDSPQGLDWQSLEQIWGHPHASLAQADELVVRYTVAQRQEGKVLAKVTVEYPLGQLEATLKRLAPTTANILLVDTRGDTLLGSDGTDPSPDWVRFLQMVARRGEGILQIKGQAGTSLAAYAPIGGTTWGLGLWTPLDVLLRESNLRNTWVLGSQVGLALVLMFFIGWVTDWLTRPLLQLTADIKLLSQGQSPAAPAVHRRDEIGQLARAFYEMSQVLRTREEKIRDLESQRFQHLVANVPGVVYRLNCASDRLEFVSDAVLALTELPPSAFLTDRSLREFVAPEDRQRVQETLTASVRAGHPWRLDYRIITLAGQVHWVEERGRATYARDGSPQFLDGILQDISDRKDLENQLRRAELEANAANQAKSDFLANMSHEIRTPMNAIIGLTHLALQTELNGKQRDYLSKVNRSAQNLLEIINEILDFSKIEAGQMSVENVDFRLDEVLDGVVNLLALRASEKSLEFFLLPDPAIPSHLLGDPLRISQVLVNLTANALKFTENGQVVVRTHCLERQGEVLRVKFAVTDSGIGMTPEQIDRVFRSFSQADSSTTRKFGGTGLGLSICKRLVELMGGEIGVESQPAQGSTFFFTIPLTISPEPHSQEEDGVRTPPSLQGLKVLVVDDNAMARSIMCELLESLSFVVTTVASGSEALSELAKSPDYAVVLMDWKMPRMSGIETSKVIRQNHPKGKGPAIIMVTNYGREETRAQAQKLELDGYLVKPVTPSQLFDSIAAALAPETLRSRGADKATPGQALLGTNILLVEDNAINQQVARELLEAAGACVQVANHGQAALEILARTSFDAVLMDVQMPVMGGYEATAEIRKNPQWSKLPVIAMTAHALAGDRQRCLDAGMSDHISKPIDPDLLVSTVARWMKGESAAVFESGATSRFEVWNQGAGLRRVGGNQGLYGRLLRDFRSQFADSPQQFAALLEARDRQGLKQFGHSLAGVAGNLGLDEISSLSRRLELNEDWLESGQLVEQLKVAFENVWQALPDDPPEAVASAPVDMEPDSDSLPQLQELSRLLKSGDPGAEALLPLLGHLFQGEDVAMLWKRLASQVESFDLDKASGTLREIEERLGISLEDSP